MIMQHFYHKRNYSYKDFCGGCVIIRDNKAKISKLLNTVTVRSSNLSNKAQRRNFKMAILVTGGAGFIGSHTCVELLNAGYDVVIADNLYNASEKAVDRVKQITGKDLKFYKADIRDKEAMNEIFEKEEIESVIHFAGLKAVGESVVKPLEYYENIAPIFFMASFMPAGILP